MIAMVWQCDVKTGLERQFEEFLGANGEWTRLADTRGRTWGVRSARPETAATLPRDRVLG
jgi:hypothetical protein